MYELNRVMLCRLVASFPDVYAWQSGSRHKLSINEQGLLCKNFFGEIVRVPVNETFEIVIGKN